MVPSSSAKRSPTASILAGRSPAVNTRGEPSRAAAAASTSSQVHRRGHRRPLAGPQRVDADRRLRRVVLVPVDQHAALAPGLRLRGDDEVGLLGREQLGQRAARTRASARSARRGRSAGGRSAAPSSPDVLAKHCSPIPASVARSSSATRQHSTIVAGAPGSRSKTTASARPDRAARASEACSSSAASWAEPDERRPAVGSHRVDRLAAEPHALGVCVQSGRVRGRTLLEEGLTVDAVGEALQRQPAPGQMAAASTGAIAAVVLDHLALGASRSADRAPCRGS